MDCGCAPILCLFSVSSDGATIERQMQNSVFWSISYQFEERQRRQLCIDLDSVFEICYKARCTLQSTKHFADRYVGGATILREIAYYAWLLLTYIVMNTIHGRLTLDPAGMHCPSWDDAFVSSCICFFLVTLRVLSTVRSRVHSANKHCVAVYCPISTPYLTFQNGLLFQMHYIVLIFVARWRHNFRKIAVKKIQKIGEKIFCTTSYRQLRDLKKNSTAVAQGRECRCAPI